MKGERPPQVDENEVLDTQQNDFIEIPTPDFEDTYRNIKHLIYDGFIPVKLQMGDITLTMKSIFPREFSYIEHISFGKEVDKIPYYFLYSIVFMDGMEVYPHRKEMHDYMMAVFKGLDGKTVEKLYDVMTTIQRYYSWSYENLEGYLYENESRYLWNIYKESILDKGLIGGFGVYNTAQESWVIFNQREDRKEQMNLDFNNSKFIVSALVGAKEVRKLDNLEKLRDTEEMRRRQEVRLKNKTKQVRLSQPINTAQELIQELHRQIRGEKDIHDRIIEQHEQRMIEKYNEKKARLDDLRRIEVAKRPKVEQGSKFVSVEEMQDQMKALKDFKKIPYLPEQKRNNYISKIRQTNTDKTSEEPETHEPEVRTRPHSKKSIFDPEVQKVLKTEKGTTRQVPPKPEVKKAGPPVAPPPKPPKAPKTKESVQSSETALKVFNINIKK